MVEWGAGRLHVELRNGRPSLRQRWMWLGNSREQGLEVWLATALRDHDLLVCFWPVGLSPEAQGWKTRFYRILARSPRAGLTDEELTKLAARISPDVAPVFLEFPAGPGEGSVRLNFQSGNRAPEDLRLPVRIEAEAGVELLDAPVGEGFHWQHTESLTLPSRIWMAIGADGKLCAGVEVSLEEYLASVNSSEMPAESPAEFLKAQVVAARSWLLANWGSHHPSEPYVVCGGDHCQCYYGPNRIQEASRRAVQETAGLVLMHDDLICDARYAKSCGGYTEPAAHVWPFADEPYLGHIRDLPAAEDSKSHLLAPNLKAESDFRQFQMRQDSGDACCSPGYAPLQGALAKLGRLYRWEEKASFGELGTMVKDKTGEDLGEIVDLVPGRRGPSGRLVDLTIVGKNGRYVATPELEIRRVLSRTHLPSSAFWIERTGSDQFILHGLGWGHGVGLCQMGAAALATQGWNFDRILAHYYPNTTLREIH
jgi:SpoIID/LytB domain protein